MDNLLPAGLRGRVIFGEGDDMSKIKWDLESAKWVADKAQNDISAFPVELIECDKCGAVFLPHIGHDCKNTVDIEFHEGVEDE